MKSKKKLKKYKRRRKEILKAQHSNTVYAEKGGGNADSKESKDLALNSTKNSKNGLTNKSGARLTESLNDKLIKRDLYKTFGLTLLAFLIIFLVWKFGGKYLP